MLSFDKKVREAVSDITIPYWEDTGEYALSEAASFLQRFANDPDIAIVKIDMLRGSGFTVTWTFSGREYVTESLFASVPISGGT